MALFLRILPAAFTISHHKTDPAPSEIITKNSTELSGASFKKFAAGVYKNTESPAKIMIFTAHITLSRARVLIDFIILSVSELLH